MKKLFFFIVGTFLLSQAFATDLVITVQKVNGTFIIHEATNAWSAGPFQNAAEVRAWVLTKDPFDSDTDVMMKAVIKAIAQSDVTLAQVYQNKGYTYTLPSPTVVAAP